MSTIIGLVSTFRLPLHSNTRKGWVGLNLSVLYSILPPLFPLHLSQRQVWTFSRYITPPKVQAILFIF